MEALAAAFYITGFNSYAEKLLSGFGWGGSFWSVNQYAIFFLFTARSYRRLKKFRIYLERYQKCATSEDVITAQEALMNELEERYNDARKTGEFYFETFSLDFHKSTTW